MNRKEVIRKGKFLALLLRHQPEKIGMELDREGWAEVSDLVRLGGFTKELLDEIVKTNNKKRYAFNDDQTKIRALQGHSIDVDLKLKPTKPPRFLYHGTPRRNVDSILQNGLNKGSRQYVHLSVDRETAIDVGHRRDDQPVILRISADLAYEDGGINFYLSENGVWLTDFVPRIYIMKLS